MALLRHFSLNQAAAGTTVIAAGVPGQSHKVVGLYVAPMDGNGMNWRFTTGAAPGVNLTGPAYVEKTGVVYNGPEPLVRTVIGEALNLITTGTGARGAIIYVTEP